MFNIIDKNITKIIFSHLGNLNSITANKRRPVKVVLSNAKEIFKILHAQSILCTT